MVYNLRSRLKAFSLALCIGWTTYNGRQRYSM